MPHAIEDSIRRAAALTLHYLQHDMGAYTFCLAAIEQDPPEETADIITALILMRGKDAAQLQGIIYRQAARESV